ncbi:MAG TPA: hypothetical protein VF952_18110 [Chloroflexia bacterium]|jgi:hypothetical protein
MSIKRSLYLDKEYWGGGFYELVFEYSPGGSEEHLQKALDTLWTSPQLQGPWLDREDLGNPPVQISVEPWRMYGLLTLPENKSVGCVTFTRREEDGSGWLDFSVPTAMLAGLDWYYDKTMDTSYSPRLKLVDATYAEIADRVYRETPFQFAELGFEVSGGHDQTTLTAGQILASRGYSGYLLPPELYARLADTDFGAVTTLPSGLVWIPRVTLNV